MSTRSWQLLACAAVAIGCADGTTLEAGSSGGAGATAGQGGVAGAGGTRDSGVSGAGSGGSAGSGGWPHIGGSAGSGGTTQTCPAGEFMTGLDNGVLQCSPIDQVTRAAVNTHCSVYLGWNDSCSGCTSTPDKWGRSSDSSCSNGAGGDNTCSDLMLAGQSVRLFGLNPDGDVGDDDKFHLGLRCVDPADPPLDGPCGPGKFVSGITSSGVQCVTAEAAVVDSVQASCQLYFAWSDGCHGCSSAPQKWGQVGHSSCSNGLGVNNTCTAPTLGSESVQLFGLDADGDVDDSDTFYVGLRCDGAQPLTSTSTESCPPGQLVVGISSTNQVLCASPAPQAESVLQNDCFIYFGWRDDCDGCTAAPEKWGRVSHNTCEIGVGQDNTCLTQSLGGSNVPLFGLNLDGDVNGDDKLYLGLKCPGN